LKSSIGESYTSGDDEEGGTKTTAEICISLEHISPLEFAHVCEAIRKTMASLKIWKEDKSQPAGSAKKVKPLRVVKPDRINNATAPSWTKEQEEAIDGAETAEDAISWYRDSFPDIPRTDGAIVQRWRIVMKEKPESENQDPPAGDTAQPGSGDPVAGESGAEGNLPGSEVQELHAADLTRITCVADIPANENVVGLQVRQSKPDGNRQMHGVGTIAARVGHLIEVRNGSKKPHKIDALCLTLTEPYKKKE
jgi:hypothetical protein